MDDMTKDDGDDKDKIRDDTDNQEEEENLNDNKSDDEKVKEIGYKRKYPLIWTIYLAVQPLTEHWKKARPLALTLFRSKR